MKKIIVLLLILSSALMPAQNKDPKKMVDDVIKKFSKVRDYEVDATIKLDMSFIKVPDMKAKVYFKQPDKYKYESDGFAMLPKQGLRFNLADLLKGDFTFLYIRSDNLENRKVDLIKAIPNSDSSDVVLITIWIDTEGKVVRKIETTAKKGVTTQLEFSYDNYDFGVPSVVKLSFSGGDLKPAIPQPGQTGENKAADQKKRNKRGLPEGASLKGSVIVYYKNFKINKGIPDSFFNEKEKEKKISIQ